MRTRPIVAGASVMLAATIALPAAASARALWPSVKIGLWGDYDDETKQVRAIGIRTASCSASRQNCACSWSRPVIRMRSD
jgi:hypothetical protein